MKNVGLDRWSSPRPHSWAYAKFNSYETELMRIDMAYTSFRDYGFKCLWESRYSWDDPANKLFSTHSDDKLTFRSWRSTYNHGFESWYSLNKIVALCSYFENYLASIVQLAIESNPSLLFGHTKLVDGLVIIDHNPSAIIQQEIIARVKNKKSGNPNLTVEQLEEFEFNAKQNLDSIPLDAKTKSMSAQIDELQKLVTRGDWRQRFSNLKNIFGISDSNIIQSLDEAVADLEIMRKLRNNTAHSIGRDIEASQLWFDKDVIRMGKVDLKDHVHYQHMIKNIVRQLDEYLMNNHIGCFQELFFYHCHLDDFNDCKSVKQKANLLRELLLKIIRYPYSNKFCVNLIEYYEKIRK